MSRRHDVALAKRREQGQQGQPEDREVTALDPLEEGHAAALHPEHPDAIRNLGPFGVKIVIDEGLRQRTDMKMGDVRHAPVDLAAPDERRRACQFQRTPRESREMAGGLIPVARFGVADAVERDRDLGVSVALTVGVPARIRYPSS